MNPKIRKMPQNNDPIEEPTDSDRLNSREGYTAQLSCLYNNKKNLQPSLYSSLKHTVLPSIKMGREGADSYAKQIVYRSLFKNCYSNLEDESFLGKLTIFHSHFERLCDNVYPFTKLKQAFPNYLPQINKELEMHRELQAKGKEKSKETTKGLKKGLYRNYSTMKQREYTKFP